MSPLLVLRLRRAGSSGVILALVPKLRLGMPVRAKLCFAGRGCSAGGRTPAPPPPTPPPGKQSFPPKGVPKRSLRARGAGARQEQTPASVSAAGATRCAKPISVSAARVSWWAKPASVSAANAFRWTKSASVPVSGSFKTPKRAKLPTSSASAVAKWTVPPPPGSPKTDRRTPRGWMASLRRAMRKPAAR